MPVFGGGKPETSVKGSFRYLPRKQSLYQVISSTSSQKRSGYHATRKPHVSKAVQNFLFHSQRWLPNRANFAICVSKLIIMPFLCMSDKKNRIKILLFEEPASFLRKLRKKLAEELKRLPENYSVLRTEQKQLSEKERTEKKKRLQENGVLPT